MKERGTRKGLWVRGEKLSPDILVTLSWPKYLRKQLKGKKDLFWLTVLEDSVHHGKAKQFKSSRKQRKWGYRKRTRQDIAPRATLNDLLPPKAPPPTFHHLPIMLSYYDSIKELIISGNSLTDIPRGVLY
jgi:hypothetical protein